MNDKKVEIIIPTLKRIHAFKCFRELHHVPFQYKLNVITEGNTWAEAINIGLERVDSESDVILMDDDVIINEDTFSLLDFYYDRSDIFGFKLFFPDGRLQHAGAYFKDGIVYHYGHSQFDDGKFNAPRFVCHVTTSLIYIKSNVLRELKRMTILPGVQHEDVDFCFRALKKGFRILYLPTPAVHMESATKMWSVEGFERKMAESYSELIRLHLCDDNFKKVLESYPKELKDVEERTYA
jgi:GT2 family glycosyltransferase